MSSLRYFAVHVAIPHYNAPEALAQVLAQVTQDDFDSITVLDDHSTDQAALEAAVRPFAGVTLVRGETNRGAGGNRNRFLSLNKTGVVWFLDCDMRIETPHVARLLRQKFSDNDASRVMLGGTILYTNGQPMAWNYGHEMHPVDDKEFSRATQAQDQLMLQRRGWDYPWIWGQRLTADRQVDWVAEGSFALWVDDFLTVGGYDTDFRYHEGQDLAHRLRQAGVTIRATGDIVCTHLDIDVRGPSRGKEIRQATKLFYQKHPPQTRV